MTSDSKVIDAGRRLATIVRTLALTDHERDAAFTIAKELLYLEYRVRSDAEFAERVKTPANGDGEDDE